MKKTIWLAALAVALQAPMMASPIITIEFSVGPVGSALAQYRINAFTALETGAASVGDISAPSYFATETSVYDGSIVSGGFDSWGALPDPGTVFGSAFANQHGQQLMAAIEIDGNGTNVDPGNLQVIGASSPLNVNLEEAYYAGQLTYGMNVMGCDKSGALFINCITNGLSTTGKGVIFLTLSLGSAQADCTQAGSCVGLAAQAAALQAAQKSIVSVVSDTVNVEYCSVPATCDTSVVASAQKSVDITSAPEPGTGLLAWSTCLALTIFLANLKRGTAPTP